MRCKQWIFDMDGTLTDSMTVVWRGAPLALLQRYGRTPKADLNDVLLTMGMADGARYLIREYGLPLTEAEYYDVMRDVIAQLYETVDLKPGVRTLRAFGRVRGCAYAVDNGPDSSADAAAFRARFDAVQKAVREKYPVTLTADAALLLARMKDAELAPLEAVAEDVGVDPTVYYTTRTLGQAFLDKCDRARMAGFAPLFAGSADAGRAALAALLPNTFLQALVWQALTAPELPEVTEHEDL